MKKQLLLATLLSLFSTLTLAHPGHALSTAYAGWMHPFTGWDHLLMMLAVGFWAAKSSGGMRWKLPLTFMVFMAIGASLGLMRLAIPGVETAIAASLIAMGVVLAVNLPIATIASVVLVAVFALFHGLAHGVELGGANNQLVLIGMLSATALLHGLGYVLGAQQLKIRGFINAGLALAMLVLGSALLVS